MTKAPSSTRIHDPVAQQAWKTIAQLQAAAAKGQSIGDIRIAQIHALSKLGLRTLALPLAKQLIGTGIPDQTVHDLVASIEALPDDLIPLDQREHTMHENLKWMPKHLHPSSADLIAWREVFGSITWLRTTDGNIVRCNLQNNRVGHLEDIRNATKKNLAPLLYKLQHKPCRPIVLEGVDPLWILQELLHASESVPTQPGFRQPLLIVQRNPCELYNGLGCAYIGEPLGDDRLQWFVGDDAGSRLQSWILERITVAPLQCTVQNPLLREKIDPTVKQINEETTRVWNKLATEIVDTPHPRSPESWVQRYKSAASGGPPLRIAIITSRFSTYTRYIAQDLCNELNSSGTDATLLMEPDDFSVTSDTYYRIALQKINPDLILTINYPRHSFGNCAPKDVPFVCWVQDAMPHLFSKEQGQAFGPLDFMVGMVHPRMHEEFCYPASQLRWLPMNASTTKFTPNTQSPKRACDIAWVTHHGASVEHLHHLITSQFLDANPSAKEIFDHTLHRIVQAVGHPTHFVHSELAKICNDPNLRCIDGFNDDPSDTARISGYINQIAERAYRIETARWAVSIAKRRQWTLRLHGNGWDTNPEFSAFAAPPIDHGKALASCYANAGVHLHASLTQPLHQRVAECAFAGGLALCRIPRDAFSLMNDQAVIESQRRGIGASLPNDSHSRRIQIKDIPVAQRMVSHLRRLGLCEPEEYTDGTLTWPGFKIRDALKSDTEENRAYAVAFEKMAELFFANEQTLEQLIERALDDAHWRAQQSAMTRNTLSDTMTIKVFADKVLSFVREGLDAAAKTDLAPTC